MDRTTKKVKKARRLVIKVGSAVLAMPGTGGFNRPAANELASQIARLQREGRQVVLVSSGAVFAGRQMLGEVKPAKALGDKQALAAIGQVELMNYWREVFAQHDIHVAQILLTREDLASRARFLNARRTILNLLGRGVLPVINENDTVAVEEIKFGDNDRLSALVTNLVTADLLVLLTEVSGLYTADPKRDVASKIIPYVPVITPEIIEGAGGAGLYGTGGMASKVEAARQACLYGVPAVIAAGKEPDILIKILAGEGVGTLFSPATHRLDSRRHWIAFARQPKGRLILDEGASSAILQEGCNLLPSGIMGSQGNFAMGDTVELVSAAGRIVARGITSYGTEEIRRIKGLKSSQIEQVLGYKTADEVVPWEMMVVSAPNTVRVTA